MGSHRENSNLHIWIFRHLHIWGSALDHGGGLESFIHKNAQHKILIKTQDFFG